MKILMRVFLPVALLTLSPATFADPDKDESGHGKGRGYERREYRDHDDHGRRHRHGRGEFKEEYTEGNCKVERKREKNGEYKEERKCSGPSYGRFEQAPVYVPGPAPVYEDPGLTIRIR